MRSALQQLQPVCLSFALNGRVVGNCVRAARLLSAQRWPGQSLAAPSVLPVFGCGRLEACLLRVTPLAAVCGTLASSCHTHLGGDVKWLLPVRKSL
jgi:hypothetical protein